MDTLLVIKHLSCDECKFIQCSTICESVQTNVELIKLGTLCWQDDRVAATVTMVTAMPDHRRCWAMLRLS